MSQTGVLTRVVSVDGTDFEAAVVQNAGLLASLPVVGRKGSGSMIVRSLFIQSAENAAWEVNFYATAAGRNANPNIDSFQGRHAFAAADGLQTTGDALFRYYVDDLGILTRDADDGGELHVELVPRSAAGKALSAAFRIGIAIEFPGAWG